MMLREYLERRSVKRLGRTEIYGFNSPTGGKCRVGGTLGRFCWSPFFDLPNASCVMSLYLRLPRRVLDLLSVASFVTGFVFVVGASEGVAMALESSLGELGVFEEECLR